MSARQDIVLATGNPGKLRELTAMYEALPIRLRAMNEFDCDGAEETACTFVENALLKARHVAQATGLPCIADDSGLAVDALQGAPGVRSARYAGPDADDTANNRKLLEALRDIDASARGAEFICVMVFLQHPGDPTPLIAEGRWRGRILNEARGHNGFGYDPLFLVDGLQMTSAELEPEQKNAISHRGQAARLLREGLAERL